MKKLFILAVFFTLFGCEVGNFGEERESLHSRHGNDICEKQPERCINGVAW